MVRIICGKRTSEPRRQPRPRRKACRESGVEVGEGSRGSAWIVRRNNRRKGLLKDSFNVDSGTLGLVNVAKGLDPVNVANLLKKDFIQLGMLTIVIEVTIEQGQRIFLSFFGLFEGYLALGLVVGVAGVGIISIRSVVERRNEIGILRALGFRKRMVM